MNMRFKKRGLQTLKIAPVIVEKDEPIATLSTCYPFTYIGSAPDRYIIQAHLVQKGELLS